MLPVLIFDEIIIMSTTVWEKFITKASNIQSNMAWLAAKKPSQILTEFFTAEICQAKLG